MSQIRKDNNSVTVKQPDLLHAADTLLLICYYFSFRRILRDGGYVRNVQDHRFTCDEHTGPVPQGGTPSQIHGETHRERTQS